MNFTKHKLVWLFTAALALVGLAVYLGSTASAGFVWAISNGGAWFLPILVVAALADSVNPCAFSILLLTIAFLFQIGQSHRQILKIGAVYIAGIFAAYLAIGLGILGTLHLFNTPHFMAKVGALLLAIFGALNVLEVVFPNFPLKLRIPSAAHGLMARLLEKTSLPAVFLLGAVVGLCEFPCTGGPYLTILGFLHDQQIGLQIKGFGYLVLYNLLFILPLGVMLAIASQEQLLAKAQAWQQSNRMEMRLASGILMLAIAALIYFL